MDELLAAAEFARDLVARAAPVAHAMQGKVSHREKGGGDGPVSEADYAIERILLDGLRERFPLDPVLSEESAPPEHVHVPRLWCIDPLDGTREYLQGLPEYAVMVGLLLEGRPAVGAMALPGTGEVFWGGEGIGAWRGADPLALPAAPPLARATAIHSRKHRGPRLQAALRRLGVGSTIAAGGVGYKVAQILNGRAHLYVHPRGGVQWWDSVAPAAILLAAGGGFATGRGRPMRYEGGLLHAEGLLFTAPGLGAEAARLLGEE